MIGLSTIDFTQTQTCRTCGEVKPFEGYNSDVRTKSGKCPRCRQCDRKLQSTYYAKNKAKHQEYSLLKKYGMTLADREALIAAQGGACAICGTTTPTGHGARLHVDHCHATGEVRGMLCTKCNRALGLFEDNTESLASAITYLQQV